MVDYIADYLKNIRNRRVMPNVSPGYMRHLVPESAPIKGEDWNVIINDVERVIMPGVSVWFHELLNNYDDEYTTFTLRNGQAHMIITSLSDAYLYTFLRKFDKQSVLKRWFRCS